MLLSGTTVYASYNNVWEKTVNLNFDDLPPLTQRYFVKWQMSSLEFDKTICSKFIKSNNKRISDLNKKILEVITKANGNYSDLIDVINQVIKMDENSQLARQQLTKRIKKTIETNSLLFRDLQFYWNNEYKNYRALKN